MEICRLIIQLAAIICPMIMTLTNPDFARGVELFNHAHFFDAHEVLEDLWRPIAPDAPLRRHLQGMVQLAVAFHHESTGNYVGARSVLSRALRNLNGVENSFPSLDLDRLRADLEPWLQFLLHPPGADMPAQILQATTKNIRGAAWLLDDKKLSGRQVHLCRRFSPDNDSRQILSSGFSP